MKTLLIVGLTLGGLGLGLWYLATLRDLRDTARTAWKLAARRRDREP